MSAGLRLFFPLSLLLTACSLAPDYSRPQVLLPDQYAEPHQTGESAANLKWWTLFQDPLLQELIREALANNRDLKLSLARIEEAQALLGFVRADQFPAGDITANAGRSDAGYGFGPSNSFGLFGTLSYEVDLWGKLRNATEAQRAELLAISYNQQTLELTLVSQVAELYFSLIDLDQRVIVSKNTLVNRRDATKVIRARFEKGVVSELDLNQAEIEEADVSAVMHSILRERQRVEHALLTLLGKSSGSIKRAAELKPVAIDYALPAGLPANVLEQRPDLKALESRIQSSQYLEGVTEAQRLPSIDLFGTIGLAGSSHADFFSSESRSWSVGGGLLAPVIDWDKNKERAEAQKARTEQARMEYEGSVLRAVQEVEDALIDIRTYNDEYNDREKQIKSASNANRLSRARYNDGVSPYLEVLDVERSLYSAQLQSSQAQRAYINSLVKLYKALGGGWNPDGLVQH